jgi:hypothetical protein
MSRRHHGRPHHGHYRHEGPRQPGPEPRPGTTSDTVAPQHVRPHDAVTAAPPRPPAPPSPMPQAATSALPPAPAATQPPAPTPAQPLAPSAGPMPMPPTNRLGNGHAERSNGCTAPQLRRFIKSRPYVPMHELRRRFGIDGVEDDVTQVALEGTSVYVGLPGREGALLGELLRGGEIGYELSLDPRSPIVVGVYPMRPVPRT